MKHRIPYSWSIRLPVSVRTHTPSYRKRKRFLAFARNDGTGEDRPSSSFTPPHRVMPLQSTLSCAFVRLSLLPYRHPERSRGIFVAAAFLIHMLIRLHETPYPTFLGYQASRFRSRAYTVSTPNEKDFSLSLEMTVWWKRYSRRAFLFAVKQNAANSMWILKTYIEFSAINF